MYRLGLDRFKKAETDDPFKVDAASVIKSLPPRQPPQQLPQRAEAVAAPASNTAVGEGQSTWVAPEWATDPKPGVWSLDVMKDGTVVDKIPLDRKRVIFGRQAAACDFVLDHPSVSRQHLAVIHHKNNSMFVMDLGSVHGSFAGQPPERLTKGIPVELEAGQSLRFAASTRIYILRKQALPPPPAPPPPHEALAALPPPPDPSDEAALVAYNTSLNRLGLESPVPLARDRNNSNGATGGRGDPPAGSMTGGGGSTADEEEAKRAAKRARRRGGARVSFRDQYGGELAHVFGVSDGADVGDVGPTPVGEKEGSSLVGKYESLVRSTIIPKGEKLTPSKEKAEPVRPGATTAITQRLQQYLDRVKVSSSSGLYGNLLESAPAPNDNRDHHRASAGRRAAAPEGQSYAKAGAGTSGESKRNSSGDGGSLAQPKDGQQEVKERGLHGSDAGSSGEGHRPAGGGGSDNIFDMAEEEAKGRS